ncbi:MAG: hypothetical protein K8R21_15955 [Leptospira sp.]|nr:hypothetical protein [Leptospira sp.]
MKSDETVFENIPVSISKTYIIGNRPSQNSNEEILKIMTQLVSGIIRKDLKDLPGLMNKEKGIYLDLKGLWTYPELERELSLEESYFKTFFFEHDHLVKRKNSQDVRTVRDLLLLSQGIEADFFYENPNSCELKLKFSQNKKFESELNNPYFLKINGKWYVYRLF